ncbi:hypothetical protein JCM8097_004220 [Rhodosporidiobolus ruineniae]
MLDRLPLELVQYIVFLTLPSSSSFTKYRERQDPLLALCSTSRALCDVAQPVLFEAVNLEKQEAISSFLEVVEANKALGERVKALRLENDEWDDHVLAAPEGMSYAGLARFGQRCHQVLEVVVFRQYLVFPSFEAFPSLVRLTITHCTVVAHIPVRLSRLEELSLMCIRFSGDALFTPSSFPRLEALHLHLVEDLDEIRMVLERMLAEPHMFPALTAIVFPVTFLGDPIPGYRASSSTDFEPLRRLCTTRNVELIFEDLPHPHYDSFISPEFVRRCKAQRAKKATDEVEEGEKE